MKALLALPIVLLIVLSSCGDSSGPSPLSRIEYISQANAVCAIGNSETQRISDEVFGRLPEEPTVEEAGVAFQAALERSTPIFEAVVADLRALPAPADDAELLDSLFNRLEIARAQVLVLADQYAAGDADVAEVLAGPDQPFAAVNQQLAAYGLTECG